jgi:hypothetical protein
MKLKGSVLTALGVAFLLCFPANKLAESQTRVENVIQPAASTSSDLPREAQLPVSAALGRDESIYYAQARSSGYTIANSRQKLAADFSSQGVDVVCDGARWGMRLQAYGYGDVLTAVAGTAPRAISNRIEYSRGALTEWYVNGPMGLEQGFTVARAAEAASHEPLTLAMLLSGDLEASLDQDRTGVKLAGRRGKVELKYGGLSAFDASGKALPAWIELANRRLLLRVDTAAARYPITIDPIIQSAKLTASDGQNGDGFGISVAISGDTVVVGADEADHTAGAAYVFVKPASGWTNLTQTAKLTPSDGQNGLFNSLNFGYAVAISGNTIVVGQFVSRGTVAHSRSAYIFVEPPGGWTNMTETARLRDPEPGDGQDSYGTAVAISGNTVVVGSQYTSLTAPGRAYVFVEPESGWSTTDVPTAQLSSTDSSAGDAFGESVVIDGGTIAISSPWAPVNGTPEGAIYVYAKPADGWTNMTQTAKLAASDLGGGARFGGTLALSGDTVVTGSYLLQSAYVFVEPTGGWANMTQTAKLSSLVPGLFVDSVAINASVIAVGSVSYNNSLGAVYVFVKPAGGWRSTNQQAAILIPSDGTEADNFGISVGLSESVVIAGSYRQPVVNFQSGPGAAYLFEQ